MTKILLKSKGDFYQLSLRKYSDQGKKLISKIDDYTEKLKRAII